MQSSFQWVPLGKGLGDITEERSQKYGDYADITGGVVFVFYGFFCFVFWFFFVLFCFLGLHLQHIEVPRLGVESELQLRAYPTATATRDLSRLCDLHHSSWQCHILHPLSRARHQTYILMDTSQICFCWATMSSLFLFFDSIPINYKCFFCIVSQRNKLYNAFSCSQ